MAIEIKFNSNLFEVKNQMKGNVERALTALGTEAVGIIGDGMDNLYDDRIYDTGSLHRDVNYKVDVSSQTVDVGNSLEYATYVHEGYSGHPVYIESIKEFRVLPGGHTKGRPYIRDSLMADAAHRRMQDIVEAYLKQGFE